MDASRGVGGARADARSGSWRLRHAAETGGFTAGSCKILAIATAVRDILRSFVSANDNDYRLRCAPERFRTRVFRDLAQNFNDIVDSAAKFDFSELPDSINGISQAIKVIIDVSRKMQGICRRAKKDIKRHGSSFWSKLDAWNAMRRAI